MTAKTLSAKINAPELLEKQLSRRAKKENIELLLCHLQRSPTCQLKKNYPESYDVISDKTKAEEYVKTVVRTINKSGVSVRGVCVHYPKITVME